MPLSVFFFVCGCLTIKSTKKLTAIFILQNFKKFHTTEGKECIAKLSGLVGAISSGSKHFMNSSSFNSGAFRCLGTPLCSSAIFAKGKTIVTYFLFASLEDKPIPTLKEKNLLHLKKRICFIRSKFFF